MLCKAGCWQQLQPLHNQKEARPTTAGVIPWYHRSSCIKLTARFDRHNASSFLESHWFGPKLLRLSTTPDVAPHTCHHRPTQGQDAPPSSQLPERTSATGRTRGTLPHMMLSLVGCFSVWFRSGTQLQRLGPAGTVLVCEHCQAAAIQEAAVPGASGVQH